jgi:phosphoketolase
MDSEVSNLLEKGALITAKPVPDHFVSNLFLVPKRDGSALPVINLNGLNRLLHYQHFQMERIHLLRKLLQPGAS